MIDDTDWTLIDFGDQKKAGVDFSTPASLKPCPKCGRELGRGGHIHVKSCKGEK